MSKADRALDITADVCPMTFVRTKLCLEKMEPGETVIIRLRGGEPLENVPRAALDHGHEVLAVERVEDDIYEIVIRKQA
ncbi:sulfurtransferase TusA family protein [Geminicoccaceae bacterium 1502E]|nr:sulfurtransferase TusA family protein [Geminicoccaceae bacterium 1502E]